MKEYLSKLRRNGAVVIPDFFSANDIQDAKRDIRELFSDVTAEHQFLPEPVVSPDVREFLSDGAFDRLDFPFQRTSLNLLGVDHRIVALAQHALDCDRVLMHYQYASAKYGGKKNYSQPLHLDSPMHSFFAPNFNVRFSAINFSIYLSDVNADSGPFSYVPLSATRHIKHGKITLDHNENVQLQPDEEIALGREGSLLMYYHHTYHRGTNLKRRDSFRFQLAVSYHAHEATPFIGGLPWPLKAFMFASAWKSFLPHASVDQLEVIGFPRPDHEFWTIEILDDLQQRFPLWNLERYYRAQRKD